MSWTPVQEIIGKIVSAYESGSYPDRDQKRFAFYERLNMESESFEEWLTEGDNPFLDRAKYSDEPVVYEDNETQEEWEKWLAVKGIDLHDEYR